MPWTSPTHTLLSGNTAGSTFIQAGQFLTLQAGNNITLSGAQGKIVISGPNTVAGGGGVAAGVGATGNTLGNTGTASSGTVYFAASGGLTASQSTGAGISTVWYSVGAYITTARASTDAVGLNSAGTSVTWTVNSSGISFDGGNYLTTARRSTDAVGLNTAGTSVTWTVNSSGISFDGGNYLTTARRSTDAVGLNTAQTNVLWTVNSSGISLNASAYLTTARASTDAVGLNTAQTGVLWTVNSSGISLNAGAYLTTARGSTDAVGLNTSQTNVTWTVNSSGLSLNAGGYAGTGTAATNASVTLNTVGISINVNTAKTVSYWENPNLILGTSWSGTSNSISVQRLFFPAQISATRADLLLNISGSASGQLSMRINVGLYTAANSTLNSVSTTSRGFSFSSTGATSYSNVSGVRSWSIGLGTWNILPGEYFLAVNAAWTTGGSNTNFIQMYGGNTFPGAGGLETAALGNVTNAFRSGMINSAAASVLPAALSLVDMTQTGASIGNQPWIALQGTF